MSGNAWMVSDMIDDEDLDFLKHDFLTYYQGADYYGLGLKSFTKLAHEAGAVYKLGKRVLIRRDIFDGYLRTTYARSISNDEPKAVSDFGARQGILIQDPVSGRMDVRFGLSEYFGCLPVGKQMDVLVDGEWVHTQLKMGKGWYLPGVETSNLAGLVVRIRK